MRRLLLTALLVPACNLALPLGSAPAPEAGVDGPVAVDAPRRDARARDLPAKDFPAKDVPGPHDTLADRGLCDPITRPKAGPCTAVLCSENATWVMIPTNEGNPCSDNGEPGTCREGACCTGCWDPAVGCKPGTADDACALGGALCLPCPATTAPCELVQCNSGTCVTMPAGDGTSCTTIGGATGQCYGGACCTGCWDGMTCQPGTSVSACGVGGGMCETCVALAECEFMVCVVGKCLTKNEANGTACGAASGDQGMCYVGACCTGCWDAGGMSCVSGTAATACGDNGELCLDCTAMVTSPGCALNSDGNWSCTP